MTSLPALALSFEQNIGQADKEVKFLARGNGYALRLTPTEAILTLHVSDNRSRHSITSAAENHRSASRRLTIPSEDNSQLSVLQVKLAGAKRRPQIEGIDARAAKANYYIGNNPAHWHTNVPLYARVKYTNVYPGIDLVYHGSNQQELEYDFVVAPGADPRRIRLAFDGSDTLRLRGSELVVRAGDAELVQHAPVIYQEVEGTRRSVTGSYVLLGSRTVGFRLGDYDRTKPLIIDPTLSYLTYVGGNLEDVLNGLAVDSAGNVYVEGWTSSTEIPNFPTAVTTLVPQFPRASTLYNYDAIITKYDPSGAPLFVVYFGGASGDVTDDVAVDSAGNIWFSVVTHSTDLPMMNAFQPQFGGGGPLGDLYDAAVVKLSPTGNLLFSSYLGGSDDDEASAIAVDSAGNAYVAGNSVSSNFPTLNAYQSAFGGPPPIGGCYGDAFVAKFDPNGALIYSTYLGGKFVDLANTLALDSSRNAYVAGMTVSTDFPANHRIGPGGLADGFVAKLSSDGSKLIDSALIGGSKFDAIHSVAVDALGGVYVLGTTYSDLDLPLLDPFQSRLNGGLPGGQDFFVAKLSPNFDLRFSSYMGAGSSFAYPGVPKGIGVAPSGSIYVALCTDVANLPTTPNAPQPNYGGGPRDGYLAKITPAGACGEVPDSGCRKPTKAGASVFQLKHKVGTAEKDALKWTWNKGDATALSDFGGPVNGGTEYRLCVYDSAPSLVAVAGIGAGGTCAGKPCWSATKAGFNYMNKDLTAAGILQLQLTAGAAGKAKVKLTGKGENLMMPALPLAQAPTVVVELKNTNGVCWAAEFSAPAKQDDSSGFKDTSDAP